MALLDMDGSASVFKENLGTDDLAGKRCQYHSHGISPAFAVPHDSRIFLGLSWGPYNPLISTLVQQRVPAHLHGQVFGVQTAVFYAAPPLGMVLTGLSVESFGVNATYAFLAGVLSLTSVLVLLTKSLRSDF